MSFKLAHLKGARIPPTLTKDGAAGADWLAGALLVMDANGDWAECGADPASIAAVALGDYGADTSGFVRTGRKEFPPGQAQAVAVANEVAFRAQYVGALPAAVGGSYGVVLDADNKWKVDFGDAVNTRVKLISLRPTEAPINDNEVVVVFLAANVQIVG